MKIISISPDVSRVLEQLNAQGYFCQVDVETPLADLVASKRLLDLARVRGWVGELERRLTHVGGLGQVVSYFDPARLSADMVDELVKDEVISRWSPPLTEKGPR